ETECSLLYTSGTTGRPKGCILTNLYYLNSGAWYRDMGGLVVIEYGRDRILNPLPLYHMNSQGLTATCAMLTANCLILPERFSPTRWWQDVAATRATIVHYLGVVPPMLLNLPVVPAERQHAVKFGIGAGVEPELRSEERRVGKECRARRSAQEERKEGGTAARGVACWYEPVAGGGRKHVVG